MIRNIVLAFFVLTFSACDIDLKGNQGKPDIPAAKSASISKQVETEKTPAKKTVYVGSSQCQLCHVSQHQDWLHSNHHKAMQAIAGNNALGNFSSATLDHHQQTTVFTQNDSGKYRITTDSNSATPANLDLEYTFGIFPLQQYLAPRQNGALYSLPFAWDSRPKKDGGQRWFHLYENEKIIPGDALHWTSASHNANHMCIECHTTNFIKNYNAEENSYQSTWVEIGVGCESCHGPGSTHIEWARSSDKGKHINKGWNTSLTSGSEELWIKQQSTSLPQRIESASSSQIENCAQCHSRRSRIHKGNHEEKLTDAFAPALLDEGLYYPDGQIQDEVFEYGSFMQSRMAQRGVTCSNCHNPHSGKLKAQGNGVCLQCHDNSYNTEKHVMHKLESPGSNCVDCHMPATVYMAVDARRDHSLRIPRPDLTTQIGTPNACNKCHTEKSAEWAEGEMESHYGNSWKTSHFGTVIAAARRSQPDIYPEIERLIRDESQAALVRGTALGLLQNFPTRNYMNILKEFLNDPDPIIKTGALRMAENMPEEILPLLVPLLDDKHRVIRIEAARLLAGSKTATAAPGFSRARLEYIESQQLHSDTAAAQVNLAGLAMREQRWQEAEQHLQTAQRLEPYFIPAAINLADLYRVTRQDGKGLITLSSALKESPENPDLNLAYGLTLVRNSQLENAMPYLQKASQHGNSPRYSYVYSLALHQAGNVEAAMTELDRSASMAIYSRDIYLARVDFAMQSGSREKAKKYLTEFEKKDPWDPAVRQIATELEKMNPE